MFTPLHDGCLDRDPLDNAVDELNRYRADLDQLDLTVDDAADDPGPRSDHRNTSFPWDE